MITKEEVQKVAKLARLKCEGAEIVKFTDQLSKIMDMINILNEVDCIDVKPLTSVCDMSARTRKDQVTSEDISDNLFDNFPGEQAELAKEVKYFIVPKVVE